jgi:putative lipoprotein
MATLKIDRRSTLILGAAAMLLPGMSSVPATASPPAEPAPASAPVGLWVAEAIGGSPVSSEVQSTLEITADGTASGQGGCNSFRGNVVIAGQDIAFGGLASTMMACAEPAMGQERRFHDALNATRSFRIDGELGTLLLRDTSGTTVMVLKPQ